MPNELNLATRLPATEFGARPDFEVVVLFRGASVKGLPVGNALICP
jgi:hypothetical protein